MVTSAALAGESPRPAVSAVAPVAASICRRVSPFPILVMSFLPEALLFLSPRHSGARAQRVNPESRCKHRLLNWIPGSLATLAPWNDAGMERHLLLLHSEFLDCSRNVVEGLCDDLPQ